VGGQRVGQTVGGQRVKQTVVRQSEGQTVVRQREGQTVLLIDRGHPILVRTSPSDRDLSAKLMKYFGSRSKSGGGECDVTRVDGQTYYAIFQNQDDQRRVLGKGNHIIEYTMSVTVQDIERKDLARIRQLSRNEERLKMQHRAV
ncbi:unnamed protein product, partial [Staurois parvus]